MPYLIRPDGSVYADTIQEAVAFVRAMGVNVTVPTAPVLEVPAWPAEPAPEPADASTSDLRAMIRSLCDGIPRTHPAKGRPPADLADVVYSALIMAWSGASARGVGDALRVAEGQALVDHVPAYNTLTKYMNNPRMMEALTRVLTASATPLREGAAVSGAAVFVARGRGGRHDRLGNAPPRALLAQAMADATTHALWDVSTTPHDGKPLRGVSAGDVAMNRVQRKFGDELRAQLPAARHSEIVLKCICHNLAQLEQRVGAGGAMPRFW